MRKVEILLAEDDYLIQKMVITIMNDPNYIIDIADNGNTVVEKSNMKKYDIIFMDLLMPGLDGIEATRAIRHSGNTTPIIGLSAYHDKEEIKKCLQAGMNDFMVKPVFKDDIVKMINAYVKNEIVDAKIYDNVKKIHDKFAFMGKMSDETKIEIINDYLKYIPEQINLLSGLIDQKNFIELSSNTHRFKGSFFSIGTVKLNEILIEIELKANEQKDDFVDLLEKMKSELNDILKDLSKYLEVIKKNGSP